MRPDSSAHHTRTAVRHVLRAWRGSGLLVAACAVVGCVDATHPHAPRAGSEASLEVVPSAAAQRHLVVFAAERVPADFSAQVEALGGSIETTISQVGVASVVGLTDAAAAQLASRSDVRHVEPTQSAPDLAAAPLVGELAASDVSDTNIDEASSPTEAALYHRQWNLRAIHADAAWAAGHRGSRNVTVAILDTGLDYDHPELQGMVDLERSRSFVPEDDPIIAARFPGRLAISDLNYHGSAVATIVGTNAVRLAGVNRHVTFLAVKIWNSEAQGAIDRLIAGIVYASDQGADVINVSGNYTFVRHERPGAVAAVERAVNYAWRNGAIIVSASGNDGLDLDHSGNIVRLPCQAAHVLCVHATAPTSAGGLDGPWHEVDALAGYSGFGYSAVDVAAPGGGGAVGSGQRVLVICSSTAIETSPAPACRNTGGRPIAQPGATSFAVPHVSGLAALIVAQIGPDRPAEVVARILQSADDLGEPARDPFYGHGRINVATALRVEP